LFPEWICGLVLVVAVILAYQPVWHAGFIWDDDAYVTNNVTLRTMDGLRRIWFELGAVPQYYPLVHTTFWLEYHLWGLNPLGYHLVNVLLQGVGAILLWRTLKRLQLPGAWLAAAVFALHPVQVESVAWITERKNVLSAVCYFTAALAYLRFAGLPDLSSNRRRWYYYAGALGLFVAALLSKTVTCSLPAALLLVIWWKKGRLCRNDIFPLLPFFAVGVGLGLLTAWVEKHHVGAHGSEWSFTVAQRFLIAGHALWFYATKLIWPVDLTFNYPRWNIERGMWWQWLFPLGAVAVAGIFWVRRSQFGRGPLTAVLFFAGTLLPALGFINVYPMRYSFVADHFQYLASVGLITLAAAGISLAMAGRPVLRMIFCGVLLLTLGTLTWRQSRMYSDSETLWRATIVRNPGSSLAHIDLGVILEAQGHLDDALLHFEKAVELRPDEADAHYNLGEALVRKGRTEDGLVQYRKALEIQPDFPDTQNNLAGVLVQKGKADESIAFYKLALKSEPYSASIHNNLGYALVQSGHWDEGVVHYQKAVELQPRFAEAHYNLGNAFLQKGRLVEAVVQFQTVVEIQPGYPSAQNNLGYTLLQQNRPAEAIAHLRKALEVNPDDAMAHYNLGNAFTLTGRDHEAVLQYERVLELQPNFPDIWNNLAWILATSSESSVRDGTKAIESAQKASQMAGGRNSAYLSTLSAAYAEAGKFTEAITTAQQGLKLAEEEGNVSLINIFQQQLKLYQAGLPIRSGRTTNNVVPSQDRE